MWEKINKKQSLRPHWVDTGNQRFVRAKKTQVKKNEKAAWFTWDGDASSDFVRLLSIARTLSSEEFCSKPFGCARAAAWFAWDGNGRAISFDCCQTRVLCRLQSFVLNYSNARVRVGDDGKRIEAAYEGFTSKLSGDQGLSAPVTQGDYG
ncbi:hypothetical protein CDAR_512261 [Caerostris darwini]|uniref:Uncharacterized protein n=1 Tax=Caerostris darwini TaxID=1538125 RepID=A0AAV4WJP8_9ARAC|nr:hypothetical protein CDAR_512261 [Caerostris darwini]